MNNFDKEHLKMHFKEPYPMNLLLTINENVVAGRPLDTENITQDTIDGLFYAVSMLPQREQEMLRLRFEERKTYAEIGNVYGVNGTRARYLINHAMRLVRTPALFNYLKLGKQGYEAQRIKYVYEGKEYAPEILQKHISDMGLSVKSINLLISVGCLTVEDVISFKKSQIENIYQIGIGTIREVAFKLEYMGVTDSNWSRFKI
jgi:hypothetical protein